MDDKGPGEDAAPCSTHDGLAKLVQLLPRLMRGIRRKGAEPVVVQGVPLGPRHGSALALVRQNELTVGALASSLGLNLATTSGLVADLERVGFAERSPDPSDRRRTLVRVTTGREQEVDAWMQGAAAPIERALEKLSGQERAVFVKAMGFLEEEFNSPAGPCGGEAGVRDHAAPE